MRLIALFALALLAACEGHPGSAPLAFTLIAPIDGLSTVTATPTFFWNASGRADSYRLQVATTSDFAALTVDVTGIGSTGFALTTPLAAGTLFFWRVIAVNEKGETLSATFSFGTQVAAGLPPAAFTLTTPLDLSTGQPLVPTFKWQLAPGADSYTFDLATDAAFVTIIATQTLISLPTFTSPVVLAANTVHFWRVTAVNVNGPVLATVVPFQFTTTP